MINYYKLLFKYIVFWLIVFDISRLFFMTYNFSEFSSVPFFELTQVFFYSLLLDISTICYLLAVPLLFTFLLLFYNFNAISRFVKYYHFIVVFIYVIINTGEMGVFPEWKSKLNYKALMYLSNPSEVATSIPIGSLLLLIFLALLQFSLFVFLYLKIFHKSSILKSKWYLGLITIIFTVSIFVVGLRGGVSEIPINQSQSYFSKHDVLNQTAVNPAWNLIKSYTENKKFLTTNPYAYYNKPYLDASLKKLYNYPKDSTLRILKNQKPNVILIILESWSADLIEDLGGKPGIAPYFKGLSKDGILFTEHYSSGNRSQQGLASILGGFPAIPITAITYESSKFSKLPSLSNELSKNGYATSFYFGGELVYGNIKAYIMHNNYDKIIEGKDLSSEYPRGSLGVHDEFVFNQILYDLRSAKEPFFTTFFTLSTHSPYDMPMNPVINWAGNNNDFCNSAYYTDQAIKKFIQNAKTQKWFDNTLFVFVADHSHDTYRNWGLKSFNYHKIPLLFYGNVIKDSLMGKKMDIISSQFDLPATLLNQLNINAEKFTWSRNLFDPNCPSFTYFELNDGFGWKRPKGSLIYNTLNNEILEIQAPKEYQDSLTIEGKVFLQSVFQQYLDF